jgi:hypothetical protein
MDILSKSIPIVCSILAITAYASFSMMKFGNYSRMLRHGLEDLQKYAVSAIHTKIVK